MACTGAIVGCDNLLHSLAYGAFGLGIFRSVNSFYSVRFTSGGSGGRGREAQLCVSGVCSCSTIARDAAWISQTAKSTPRLEERGTRRDEEWDCDARRTANRSKPDLVNLAVAYGGDALMVEVVVSGET